MQTPRDSPVSHGDLTDISPGARPPSPSSASLASLDSLDSLDDVQPVLDEAKSASFLEQTRARYLSIGVDVSFDLAPVGGELPPIGGTDALLAAVEHRLISVGGKVYTMTINPAAPVLSRTSSRRSLRLRQSAALGGDDGASVSTFGADESVADEEEAAAAAAAAAEGLGHHGPTVIIREPPKFMTTERLHAGKLYKVRTTRTHAEREYTSAPSDYCTEADHLRGGARSDFQSVAAVKGTFIRDRGQQQAHYKELGIDL